MMSVMPLRSGPHLWCTQHTYQLFLSAAWFRVQLVAPPEIHTDHSLTTLYTCHIDLFQAVGFDLLISAMAKPMSFFQTSTYLAVLGSEENRTSTGNPGNSKPNFMPLSCMRLNSMYLKANWGQDDSTQKNRPMNYFEFSGPDPDTVQDFKCLCKTQIYELKTEYINVNL